MFLPLTSTTVCTTLTSVKQTLCFTNLVLKGHRKNQSLNEFVWNHNGVQFYTLVAYACHLRSECHLSFPNVKQKQFQSCDVNFEDHIWRHDTWIYFMRMFIISSGGWVGDHHPWKSNFCTLPTPLCRSHPKIGGVRPLKQRTWWKAVYKSNKAFSLRSKAMK